MVDGLGDEETAIGDSPLGAQGAATPAQFHGSQGPGDASTRSSTVVFGRAGAQAAGSAGTASERRALVQTPAEVAHMRIMLESMERQQEALAQQVRALAGRTAAAGGARGAASEPSGDAPMAADLCFHEGLLRAATENDTLVIALRDAEACIRAQGGTICSLRADLKRAVLEAERKDEQIDALTRMAAMLGSASAKAPSPRPSRGGTPPPMGCIREGPSDDDSDYSGGAGSASDEDDVRSVRSVRSDTTAVLKAHEKIMNLTSAEAAAHALDMQPSTLRRKLAPLSDCLETKGRSVEQLLQHVGDAWRAAVRTSAALKAADKWLASAVMLCVTAGAETDEKAAFLADERELRARDAGEARSGRALLERIERLSTLREAADFVQYKRKIAAQFMFTDGAPKARTEKIGKEMREAWLVLPERQREGVCLVRELIKRVPPSVAGDRDGCYRDLLEEECTERENEDDERDAFTFEKLLGKIARRLARHADSSGGGGGGGGGGAAFPMTRNGPAACYNCGKESCSGHLECAERGQFCRQKYCQCVRSGGICFFKGATSDPRWRLCQRSEIKMGGGEPPNDKVWQKIKDIGKALVGKRERRDGKAAAAAAAAAAEADGGDDGAMVPAPAPEPAPAPAPYGPGKGRGGPRRVSGAVLSADAHAFVSYVEMHPVDVAYADWQELDDPDADAVAFSASGVAACVISGAAGSVISDVYRRRGDGYVGPAVLKLQCSWRRVQAERRRAAQRAAVLVVQCNWRRHAAQRLAEWRRVERRTAQLAESRGPVLELEVPLWDEAHPGHDWQVAMQRALQLLLPGAGSMVPAGEVRVGSNIKYWLIDDDEFDTGWWQCGVVEECDELSTGYCVVARGNLPSQVLDLGAGRGGSGGLLWFEPQHVGADSEVGPAEVLRRHTQLLDAFEARSHAARVDAVVEWAYALLREYEAARAFDNLRVPHADDALRALCSLGGMNPIVLGGVTSPTVVFDWATDDY